MIIDTIRPASVVGTPSNTTITGGSANIAAALSDVSNATYLTSTVFGVDSYGGLRFAAHTLAANHRRHRLHILARATPYTAGPTSYNLMGRLLPATIPAVSLFWEPPSIPTLNLFADYASSWVAATVPEASPWTVDGEMYASGGKSLPKLSELWVEIDTRAQPSFTLDVLDGDGVAADPLILTNIPTLGFSAVALDGLPARLWSANIYALATTLLPGFTPGQESGRLWSAYLVAGAAPATIATTALPNGDYVAYAQIVSTVSTDTWFQSEVEVNGFAINLPIPDPPTVVAVVTDQTVEVCVTDESGSGQYMNLPGVNGSADSNYTTPIIGAQTIRGRVRVPDLTPAAAMAPVSQYGAAGNRNFYALWGTTGKLTMWVSTDGTNVAWSPTPAGTLASYGALANEWFWWQLELVPDNGAGSKELRLSMSLEGYLTDENLVTFTLMETMTQAGVLAARFASTYPHKVGIITSTGSDFIGDISSISVRAGDPSSAIVYNPKFFDTGQGWVDGDDAADTGVDAQGNTWTLTNDATIVALGWEGTIIVTIRRYDTIHPEGVVVAVSAALDPFNVITWCWTDCYTPLCPPTCGVVCTDHDFYYTATITGLIGGYAVTTSPASSPAVSVLSPGVHRIISADCEVTIACLDGWGDWQRGRPNQVWRPAVGGLPYVTVGAPGGRDWTLRFAVEAGDVDALELLLAEPVFYWSPPVGLSSWLAPLSESVSVKTMAGSVSYQVQCVEVAVPV